jgi:hypothetical protein
MFNEYLEWCLMKGLLLMLINKKHIDGGMMSYYLGWKGGTCTWENQGCARGIKKGWNN